MVHIHEVIIELCDHIINMVILFSHVDPIWTDGCFFIELFLLSSKQKKWWQFVWLDRIETETTVFGTVGTRPNIHGGKQMKQHWTYREANRWSNTEPTGRQTYEATLNLYGSKEMKQHRTYMEARRWSNTESTGMQTDKAMLNLYGSKEIINS